MDHINIKIYEITTDQERKVSLTFYIKIPTVKEAICQTGVSIHYVARGHVILKPRPSKKIEINVE